MMFLESLSETVGRLTVFEELNVEPGRLPASASELSDRSVRDALTLTAGLARQVAVLQSVLAGVAAQRSTRQHGHGGLVQQTGHRTTVELLRDLTGATRGEAIRVVKAGEALMDGLTDAPPSGGAGTPDDTGPVPAPWHTPLRDALLAGTISTGQHDAIRRGLGDPPVIPGRPDADTTLAWQAAATQLTAEARACTVEDLAGRARTIRDLLDPAGCADRFTARFQKRSYRSWTDPDGARRAAIVYDDEAGAWMEGVFRAALSPRRGGPRFIADHDKTKAEQLIADPRSNEQLAYDLLIDLLRTGALANAKDVYGTKQAGVRLIVMRDSITGDTAHRDAFGRLVATACTHDGQLTLPSPVLERALCTTGTIELLTDTAGNPLDLGREHRLFTARQRLTLALRDGGCLWPGCDRTPEHTETHHIDPWAHGGTTDCDRGVLLCRYHHLHLHNTGWHITRDRNGPFLLHPPAVLAGDPIVLQSKTPMRWLWDPPPQRPPWRQVA